MNIRINIPDKVNEILTYLEGSGFEVFVVGGCVRDSILGKVPNDWDMCTNKNPEDIINALRDKYKVIPTGLKHGTVSVVCEKAVYEITTYRKEEGYSDSRHPDKVSFVTNLSEDLKRRDFTVNAMAYNHTSGLIDLYGGVEDLKKGIIRCVGDPNERFSEDALRILRAIRFSARLGFLIEDDTKKAVLELKDNLKSISAERIFEELKFILMCQKPYSVIAEYKPVFEVITGQRMNTDCLKFIDMLPGKLNLRLAAYLMQYGSSGASNILKCLKSDTKTLKSVCTLIDSMDLQLPVEKAQLKHLLNRFGEETLKDIIDFIKAVHNIDENILTESLSYICEIIANNECYLLSQLKINGKDLEDRGYKGREIKEKLDEILNMVIDDRLENQRAILLKEL